MLLEIPSQIGLAGKVQVVRYLLHGHFRGTQQHLCLQYDMPVYNGLRRLARHLPGDSGEITGRDTKLVRIERDLFLVEIMGMDAIDELMEQLLPTVAPILLAARKGVPCLIIHIKEEALQLVFHDHITVHVIPIHVNQPKQPDDHIYGLLLIGGMRIARAILYEAEKGRIQPEYGLVEQDLRKGYILYLEILATRIQRQDRYPVSIRSPCCAGYPIGSNRRIYSPFLYSKIRSCHIRSCKDDPITPSNRNRLL